MATTRKTPPSTTKPASAAATSAHVAARPPAPSTTPTPTSNGRDGSLHEAIARRAYQLFEAEGRRHGRHEVHWLQAEAEVLTQQGRRGVARTPSAP